MSDGQANEFSRLCIYVANEVQIIHDHATPSQWHCVEPMSNNVDKGSRGISQKKEKKSGEIRIDQGSWLSYRTCRQLAKRWHNEHSLDPDCPEVKNVKFNTNTVKGSNNILKRLWGFSSWQKVKVAVVLCLRYKRKLRDKSCPKEGALWWSIWRKVYQWHFCKHRSQCCWLEEVEVEIISMPKETCSRHKLKVSKTSKRMSSTVVGH